MRDKNQSLKLTKNNHVSGISNAPLTRGLRLAYAAANVAAYVRPPESRIPGEKKGGEAIPPRSIMRGLRPSQGRGSRLKENPDVCAHISNWTPYSRYPSLF